MTDSDTAHHVRASETIHVTVLRARNLKGVKGDVINATVKLEFGEKSLGESAKVECTPETPGEFNFDGTINFGFDDPLQYDDILAKPVILTLTEVLPKEKKQKEEKTVVLGQCAFDLLPLVQGETKYKYTLPLFPVSGSPLESITPDQPRPEVDVQLSVAESLLSDRQREDCNLLTVTMESLYSPPESWQPTGVQYVYTCCLPIPASAEKESCVVFPNGILRVASDKEATHKQKRWLAPGSVTSSAVYVPDSFLAEDNIEDEDGDFKSKEDREHRQTAEQEKNRVVWNSDRRCFLEASACRSLKEKITKNRYLPVEVLRISNGGTGKGGKDESGFGFHGMAFVDIAPLLYPGVKRIRGCYKVVAYSEDELITKSGRKTDLSEECLKITSQLRFRTGNSPFPKKGDKGGGEKKEVKKPVKPTEVSGSEADGQAPINVEGQQYTEARSYICLEINLSKPLVPKRPPEELARRVAEYIPPRPLFPKRTNSAQKAVEDYHAQVASVASLVLDEFRNIYGKQIGEGDMPQTPQDLQNRRQKLIFELNVSGKYFALKEQLKYAVVKIVREKYLKTTKFHDPNELQAFLSELYVFLVDQMHVGMHKVLSLEDQTPVPKPLTDSAQLKHFAREAEVNENYEWASKYYQERIARDRNSAEHWLDYGVFSLYLNDLTKAEECFKECVSIDPRHLSGLMLYGIVCSMQERHEVAETFFEAATCVAPDSVIAWTILGLFYDSISNDIQAEMAFIEANKKNMAEARAAANKIYGKHKTMEEEKDAVPTTAEPDKQDLVPDGEEIEEMVPSDQLQAGDDKSQPESPKSPKQSSKLAMEKKTSVSSKKGVASGRAKSTESTASARPGSKMKPGSDQQAAMDEEGTEPFRVETPVPSKTIFMHAIEFLLENKAVPYTERALAHELLEPNGGLTIAYQTCHARLKLQKREFEEVEMSLRKAIEEEYENSEAWAIMGHLKYLTGDTAAAKDCYERTVAFVSEPSEMHSIYLRLASIYLHEERYYDAKETFLYACKKSPSCVSWLGVGIACYRLHELNEAEEALAEANMLNNYDAEVWAYLSLVCLETGRKVEAEQAYKYALKLNLQDDDLMNELKQMQTSVGFGDPQL